jgi:DNA-binding HxlR family transcriptional regulator
MQRTRLTDDECPIARALDVVGDWWSLLILRESLDGATRFDQFEQHLGISPTMLTRRLRSLVEHGLLRRQKYQQRPARYEYLPTERGQQLQTVLIALAEWADHDRPHQQRSVRLVDRATGQTLDPILIDRRTGRPIDTATARYDTGPAASEAKRARSNNLRRTESLTETA